MIVFLGMIPRLKPCCFLLLSDLEREDYITPNRVLWSSRRLKSLWGWRCASRITLTFRLGFIINTSVRFLFFLFYTIAKYDVASLLVLCLFTNNAHSCFQVAFSVEPMFNRESNLTWPEQTKHQKCIWTIKNEKTLHKNTKSRRKKKKTRTVTHEATKQHTLISIKLHKHGTESGTAQQISTKNYASTLQVDHSPVLQR